MCRQTLTTLDGPERHRRSYLAVQIGSGSRGLRPVNPDNKHTALGRQCPVLSIADETANMAIYANDPKQSCSRHTLMLAIICKPTPRFADNYAPDFTLAGRAAQRLRRDCSRFFSHEMIRPLFLIVWTPATWLVRLSDVLCPPTGVRCFLGSVSQGTHHLWFGLCLLGFWWIVLSFAIWPFFRLRRSSPPGD